MEIHKYVGSIIHADSDWLVVPVTEPVEISGVVSELNESLGGIVSRLVQTGDLTGKLASLVPLRGIDGIAAKRLLFVGLGKGTELTCARLDKALVTAARSCSDKANTRIAVAVPNAAIGGVSPTQFAEASVIAAQIGSQGQDLFRTERNRFSFASASVVASSGMSAELDDAIERGRILGEAINLTRELVNRPADEVTPIAFADRAAAMATE
ncbi:MAG: peptidase M17, partial [Planctomycetes bacterium]|nr:peptidase M17 [Planctomycetota bacterium]